MLAIIQAMETTFRFIKNLWPFDFIIKENLWTYSLVPIKEPPKALIAAPLATEIPPVADESQPNGVKIWAMQLYLPSGALPFDSFP